MKYQSSRSHSSKVVSMVKVNGRFREWQNDRQDKNHVPPDFRSKGHKYQMNECIDCINQFVHSEVILINKSLTICKRFL